MRRGFPFFLRHTVGWFFRLAFTSIADDILVLTGFKWQPPTGRARWRR